MTSPIAGSAQPGFEELVKFSLFVNDTLYEIYVLNSFGLSADIPDLDDSWTYLGNIQSTVPHGELPNENLQANSEVKGAEVYHSSNGKIYVQTFELVRPAEFYGDTIVIDYKGQRSQYIATGLLDSIYEFYYASRERGVLLCINGVLYHMRAWHRDNNAFHLSDEYTYLGVISSSMDENQRPTEDFQVNNTYPFFIGRQVYQLPPQDKTESIIYNDLVVVYENEQIYYAEYTSK